MRGPVVETAIVVLAACWVTVVTILFVEAKSCRTDHLHVGDANNQDGEEEMKSQCHCRRGSPVASSVQLDGCTATGRKSL